MSQKYYVKKLSVATGKQFAVVVVDGWNNVGTTVELFHGEETAHMDCVARARRDLRAAVDAFLEAPTDHTRTMLEIAATEYREQFNLLWTPKVDTAEPTSEAVSG